MEASTNIRKLLEGNEVFVPTYQRAYSWSTPLENKPQNNRTQTDVFLNDLEEYIRSGSSSPYYFGHFLFEKKDRNKFGVVDGQQRLTTIIIFLCVIFKKIKNKRELTDEELELYEDTIKRGVKVRFSTVDYDNQIFKDYIIDNSENLNIILKTESSKKFINAFKFFEKKLLSKSEKELLDLLNAVIDASCTTHEVISESEAIQMFIFQNNRGKKPSNLEIIKAQFMYNIHLYSKTELIENINEIKVRFEEIYKSISLIEEKIDEDNILLCTLKVHFNSLWEENSLNKIELLLYKGEESIEFIKKFSKSLELSFKYISKFLNEDEKDINIHSIITLGADSNTYSFILKAYKNNLNLENISRLCSSMENLLLRKKVIGGRADITSRINEEFQKFNETEESLEKIIDLIEELKEIKDYWWSYWNNERFEKELHGNISCNLSKYILWKYENFLLSQGKKGYKPMRYSNIENPHLEHIAPITLKENEKIATGYCKYDEDFRENYLNSLGNYLLLSGSHNCSIGNKPFSEKLLTYTNLAQQREIVEMTSEKKSWNKSLIQGKEK